MSKKEAGLVEIGNNGIVTAPPVREPLPVFTPGGSGCPTLSEALAKARDQCGAASKNARNEFQKYDYASADEVISTATEALKGTGLTLIPLKAKMTVLQAGTRSCYTLQRTLVLSHKSGEFVPLEVEDWPVIEDKGRPLDKAFAIALTTSLAYLLRDLLQMPRGDQYGDDMNERDDSSHVPEPLQQVMDRAQQAGLPLQRGSNLPHKPNPNAPRITTEQAKQLVAFIDDTYLRPEHVRTEYGVDELEELQASWFDDILLAFQQIAQIATLSKTAKVPLARMLPEGTASLLVMHPSSRLSIINRLNATIAKQNALKEERVAS